ncbi:MAG: hypothetical protein QOD09_4118 [Bradyrhizobium sp.]|nr:hypothetical protein [Bradyrhizobium sp.]
MPWCSSALQMENDKVGYQGRHTARSNQKKLSYNVAPGSFEQNLFNPIAMEILHAAMIQVFEWFGSPGRIRTSDQPVNSRLLYH